MVDEEYSVLTSEYIAYVDYGPRSIPPSCSYLLDLFK